MPQCSERKPEASIPDASLVERSLGQRILFSFLATFFLIVGIIGVFLPGLPSTPFLLLMSYFLIRVSPRLHNWVMRWPIVGGILDDWHNKRGVKPSVKYYAIFAVVTLVGCTLYFSTPHWSIGVLVMGAAAIGILTILKIPSTQ